MREQMPTVFVIDPDSATCAAVRELVLAMNLQCRVFASGREFFAAYTDTAPGCLVLEVKIPDMSGLQIQRRLSDQGIPLPLIYLSAHQDVSLAVEVIRCGAVHYLQKPLRPLELINALQEALAVDRSRRKAAQREKRVQTGIAVLTSKEREVLGLIGEGLANKEIAGALQVALRTVELRRAALLKKLGLKSPMGLLRFALAAKRNAKAHLNGSHAGSRGWGARSVIEGVTPQRQNRR